MTQQEYMVEKEAMEKRHKAEISELCKKYAFLNNPYKIGDIIKSNVSVIQITKIQYTALNDYRSSILPECVYTGRTLKKDLTPTKREKFDKIYQSQIMI